MPAPGFVLPPLFIARITRGPCTLLSPLRGDSRGLHKGWGFICSTGTERGIWDLHHAHAWALSGRNVGSARES